MRAPVHIAGNGMATDILVEIRQLAQILESLGITFTHHIGGRIVIKHPNQLPGVPIGGIPIVNSIIIVIHSGANFLGVSQQLIQIAGTAVRPHHCPGILLCRPGCRGFSQIRYICSSGIGAGILLGNRKLERHIGGKVKIGTIRRKRDSGVNVVVHADGFIKPIQVIGAVHQQRIQQHICIVLYQGKHGVLCLLRQIAVAIPQGRYSQILCGILSVQSQIAQGHHDFCAVGLAGGNFPQFGFQIVIKFPGQTGQLVAPLGAVIHVGRHSQGCAGIELLVGIAGKQLLGIPFRILTTGDISLFRGQGLQRAARLPVLPGRYGHCRNAQHNGNTQKQHP